MDDAKLSRRSLLKGVGFAVAGAATAGVSETGCASMPRAGRAPTTHPCDHRFCRYYSAVDGGGRCTLKVRLRGGQP